jgi:hypothetical protein
MNDSKDWHLRFLEWTIQHPLTIAETPEVAHGVICGVSISLVAMKPNVNTDHVDSIVVTLVHNTICGCAHHGSSAKGLMLCKTRGKLNGPSTFEAILENGPKFLQLLTSFLASTDGSEPSPFR